MSFLSPNQQRQSTEGQLKLKLNNQVNNQKDKAASVNEGNYKTDSLSSGKVAKTTTAEYLTFSS